MTDTSSMLTLKVDFSKKLGVVSNNGYAISVAIMAWNEEHRAFVIERLQFITKMSNKNGNKKL